MFVKKRFFAISFSCFYVFLNASQHSHSAQSKTTPSQQDVKKHITHYAQLVEEMKQREKPHVKFDTKVRKGPRVDGDQDQK